NAQVIVMNKDAEYTGTADLVGASIAYEAGSAGQETIEAEENLSQADLVPMATQADCLPEVKAGSCQAAVLDLTLANAMIGEGTSYTDLEIKDELNVEE